MARRLLFFCLGALAVACGGDSTNGGSAEGGTGGGAGAGEGGSGADGGSASGGTASGGTGNVGTGNAGSGTAGSAVGGAGGSGAAGAGGCPAPASPDETALCISFAPETVTFEADPHFDGSGVLSVEVFDRPDPPDDGPTLFAQLYPTDAVSGGEISLSSLPVARVTRQGMPSTVYVRALFLDNADAFDGSGLTAGSWVGGLDLSTGLREGLELSPIAVAAGQGTATTVPLTPVRELTVTVDASATPVGDGQGPLFIVVTDSPAAEGGNAFGSAVFPCADVASMPTSFAVPIIAPGGRYYVAGVLNDVGLDGDFPPGVLASIEPDGILGAVIPHVLDLAATDYTPEASIDLSFQNPWPADAGAVPANSCADIAAAAPDGGLP